MKPRTKQTRKLLTIAVVLIALALAAAIYFGLFSPKKEKTTVEVKEGVPSNIIQLSPKAVTQLGLQSVTVEAQGVSAQLETTGEIKANENKVFHVSSYVGGRIIDDRTMLGNFISKGQALAVIQNIEVAKVNAEYIQQLHQNEIEIDQAKTRLTLAQQNLAREKRLIEEGISPRKDYLQAQADATIAQSELKGFKERRIHIQSEASSLLSAYGTRLASGHTERVKATSVVTAPRSGRVTKKNVTLGDMVTPDQVMYEVTDLGQIWLDITVYPKDLAKLKEGQQVKFVTDSIPDYPFSGQISYLQPGANEASQTFIARAFLNNTNDLLRPGMLGQVDVFLGQKSNKPFVPESAVQTYGKETFVFKPLENGRFQKQDVRLGEKLTGGYLVEQGVQPGDKVIGKGSFTLKAQMLKSVFAEEE